MGEANFYYFTCLKKASLKGASKSLKKEANLYERTMNVTTKSDVTASLLN